MRVCVKQVRGLTCLEGRRGVASGVTARSKVRAKAGQGYRDWKDGTPKDLNDVNAVIKPINGDPFIGMLETPVTSAPIVANFLSNLPAYRTSVAPVLRGVEIGLTHGFFITGPFIKLGPLRGMEGNVPEVAGCLAGGGIVLILTLGLTIYGIASFQGEDGRMSEEKLAPKTLTGRSISSDPLMSKQGWEEFTSGFLVGGLSAVLYSYICTQLLPYYS
ncbi:subunit XI of photosystem I reaction center [Chloropicon primus]|uniref:PSI subunit V n=1 Tax=Chloropicon primus TaxID=1764295 RepID=A0A5B8MNY4_9CHLO|nr:subunit XI of photosystem I reaction center [Chloropicon primus]UPR01335.1 subunit XI of photosystem I reaction center [Chloropicon primus]|eukprot:QDZ22117.1 subunit XI of photosystem I reaction center [Chloropicon primus]